MTTRAQTLVPAIAGHCCGTHLGRCVRRYGEIYQEIWGDVSGDMGRYGEMWPLLRHAPPVARARLVVRETARLALGSRQAPVMGRRT